MHHHHSTPWSARSRRRPQRHQRLGGAVALLQCTLGFPTAFAGGSACEPVWDLGIGQPGLNLPVHALATFSVGGSEALYVGGMFTTAGGMPASRIARWDGHAWSPLGLGISAPAGVPVVRALWADQDGQLGEPALYVGGGFPLAGGVSVNGVARWNGEAWSAVGAGPLFDVYDLIVHDTGDGPALYAATTIPTGQFAGIWRFDGTIWAIVGGGLRNFGGPGSVRALEEFDDGNGLRLHAGGIFTEAAGGQALYIARLEGDAWTQVGGGVNEPVFAMTTFDDGRGTALYIGGTFLDVGLPRGIHAVNAARWNGQRWSNLGNDDFLEYFGINEGFAAFDDGSGAGTALYIGGQDVFGHPLHRWTGAPEWETVPIAVVGAIRRMAVLNEAAGPALYVAGTMTQVDGQPVGFIFRRPACAAEETPADLDGDGAVNGIDLALLLGQWTGAASYAPCPPQAPADLNSDCQINGVDLALLLGAWTGG